MPNLGLSCIYEDQNLTSMNLPQKVSYPGNKKRKVHKQRRTPNPSNLPHDAFLTFTGKIREKETFGSSFTA